MGRNNNDFHSGKAPEVKDIREAYFSGKVTTEEANDLANSKGRFVSQTKPLFGGGDHPHNLNKKNPSDFALDHEAYYAHKRAGLK